MADTVSNRKVDLEVVPIAGHIGAEIKGVHLSSHLDQETFDAIYQKLLHHKVIFFRGQQHLDDATQPTGCATRWQSKQEV